VLLNESDPIRGFGSNPGFGGFESILDGSNKISRFFYNVENFEFFLLLRFLLPVVVTKTYSQ